MNDGIKPELCSLSYVSVDDAVRMAMELGPGALMAKLDIQSAYRMIPVHPADRRLLGMSWGGHLYVDTVLPFGLRSAPIIFTAVADALQWILEMQGVKYVMHYLDDFLLFGPPGSSICREALDSTRECCSHLGVPVAPHKTEGPTSSITFLGIELDTSAKVLRLPQEKLRRLQVEIKSWSGRHSCTKRSLLSLIGQLQHACCVVKPGRTFLRRMITLSTTAKKLHHRIRLNKGFRSDLQWWTYFLPSWRGVGMMSNLLSGPCAVTITSDASGSWGCGAYLSTGAWFQLEWPKSWASTHITVKELLPLVLAIAMWGRQWHGKSICCRCDNAAVVAMLRSGWCKNEHAMHLLRSLFFFQASYNVSLVAEHIRGVENGLADALSRDNHQKFLSCMSSAYQVPEVVPHQLMQVLVLQQPDWTSKLWTDLLPVTLQKD